jgi:hypothetical protein
MNFPPFIFDLDFDGSPNYASMFSDKKYLDSIKNSLVIFPIAWGDVY